MTREMISKPSSQTSSPSTRIPHSPGISLWQTRLGIPGKPLFDWWQCQLNFAVWCASAGCGVSVEDHLQAKGPLLAGLYRFHVYYTTRRLLLELKVPLPGDKSYSGNENAYDARAYKRLCTEFGVAPSTDWRQKLDHGCQGPGSWSTYIEPSGAYRHAHYSDGPFFHPKDTIRHNRDISRAWTMFNPDIPEGFTQAGVERLNDSIQTYVWAILGAQAQTRSNILKAGTGFDAQKQFLANVKESIASPVDIPASIKRYQKTLQYASSPPDFVLGLGLYLAPSDMALHPGNVQGYNNEIVIAGSEAAIGHNPGINEQISGTGDKSFEGKMQHQPGLITRDHRVADPQLTLRVMLTLRVSNNTRLVADEPRRKNGSHSRRGRGWPSGALVGVSLASPLRPREEGPPRR